MTTAARQSNRTKVEEGEAPPPRTSAKGTSLGRYSLLASALILLWALSRFGFQGLGDRNDFNLYLIYALLALGFYWIYGLSGQFSFAHAAFAAIGAYTSAWLTREGFPLVVAVVVATLLTAFCGAMFLIVVRRTSDFYFAIASLGLGSLVIFLLQRWDKFTGGVDGQVNQVSVFSWHGVPMSSTQISTVLLGALVAAFVVAVLIDRSPLRRDATALKHRPEVARVCGVPDLTTRLSLFVLGCAAAALAGALLAHTNGFLGPESFGNELSIGVFLMMVVGGETYLAGPLIGAAFFVFFPRVLHYLGLSNLENLLYGSTLVLLMIFMPSGILGGLDELRRALARLYPGVGVVGIGRITRARGTGRAIPRRDKAGGSPRAAVPDAAISSGRVLTGTESRLTVRDLRVSFGGVQALDGIDLDLRAGEILGIVGPNGSGKSTFLNALTGLVAAHGEVRIDGQQCRLGGPGWSRHLGVIRAFQTPQIYLELSCLDNVSVADSDRRGTGVFSALLRPVSTHRRELQRAERARDALRALGADDLVGRPVGALSYGERRWVELSRGFVANPGIVLLDEPSAGLNDEETQRLGAVVHRLRDRGASIIVVDHKVDFISEVSERVVVFDFGKIIAEGSPSEVFTNPDVIEAYTGAAPLTVPRSDEHTAAPREQHVL